MIKSPYKLDYSSVGQLTRTVGDLRILSLYGTLKKILIIKGIMQEGSYFVDVTLLL